MSTSLDISLIEAALRVASLRVARLFPGRADDASFKEHEHPRDKDGKFASGSGGGGVAANLADYKASNAGKKHTMGGFIQYLHKLGGLSNDEIFNQVSSVFSEMTPEKKSHVAWYKNDLKKKGLLPADAKAADPTANAIAQMKALQASQNATPEAAKPEASAKSTKSFGENIKTVNEGATAAHALASIMAKDDTDAANAASSLGYKLGTAEKHIGENGVFLDHYVEVSEKLKSLDTAFQNGDASAALGIEEFTEPLTPSQDYFNTLLKGVKKVVGFGVEEKPAAPAKFSPTGAVKLSPFTSPTYAAEVVAATAANDGLIVQSSIDTPALTKALTGDLKTAYEKLASYWPNVVNKKNKALIVAKDQEVANALYAAALEGTTIAEQLAKVAPLPGGASAALNGYNVFLKDLKASLGAGPAAPTAPPAAEKPPTPKLENAIYHAAKSAGHKRTEAIHHFEDKDGKDVKAVLNVNTKNIPGDFYARVTASYGNDPEPMQKKVCVAMQEYAEFIHAKRTPAQKKAILGYQDGEYDAINKYLSGMDNNPSPHVLEAVDHLNVALKDSYVPADTPVFRGLKASLKSLTGFDDPQESVGRCFEHKNFASCSRNQTTAENFGNTTMLKFTIPAGTPGIVMGGQNPGGWGKHTEYETVLGPRSMFRVDKVEQKTMGGEGVKHVVHCTYLGERKDD